MRITFALRRFVRKRAGAAERPLRTPRLLGLALDVCGAVVVGSGRDENAAPMQPFLADRSLLLRRLALAPKVLRGQPQGWTRAERERPLLPGRENFLAELF